MIPELQDIGTERNVLPLGRYLCTLDELRDRFVPEESDKRKKIFAAFQFIIGLLKEAFGSVCEVWVGGSFVTSKEEPGDIDAVFVIRADLFDHARDTELGRFAIWGLNTKHGFSSLIDAFVLFIHPTGVDNEAVAEGEYDYMKSRGYWDQFWSKTRSVTVEETGESYPSAGYLEVMLDGFGV